LEVLAHHRVQEVDDPLSRKPVKISLVRQVLPHLRPVTCLLQDALDAQGLVLRAEHDFDPVTLDVLLFPSDEVFAEVLDIRSAKSGCTYDGYGVVAAEVRLALDGKELKLLLLALVLGLPLGCGNAYWTVGFNLYHRLNITVISES
jgi:hypothetical protein